MILDEIALSMHRRVTPKTAVHLLEVFGSAGEVFKASTEELVERASLRGEVATEIAAKICHGQAENELRHCAKNGIVPIGVSSAEYPSLLRECCDYPLVLYVKGNVGALNAGMLGIVGTRKISQYGAAMCERIIGGLADSGCGMSILSGLAYGVDSAAHRAALAYGLNTVAILGNKLPRIYPAEHSSLAAKIIEKGGAVVSELHSAAHEGRMCFVARNRIIAGMARGTLIVESPEKGGSMITAEMAAGYDRVVMAVPGRATDENSAGTNRLIRSMKAISVSGAGDVIYELGMDKPRVEKASAVTAGYVNTGDPVLDIIAVSENGATVDHIADRTGLAASEIMASLFSLELEGAVRKAPGGLYFKV